MLPRSRLNSKICLKFVRNELDNIAVVYYKPILDGQNLRDSSTFLDLFDLVTSSFPNIIELSSSWCHQQF